MLEAGKLIHTATLYKSLYVKNNDGTGKNKLEYVKKVKCSIRDVSYQNKDSNNKTTEDTTLKITTHYFKSDINMLVRLLSVHRRVDTCGVKINSDETLYKITYIENVEFVNKILIFSLSKNEGSYD